MKFNEKLTELLSLTATKGAELADALNIGRPYVSRMKTGERKLPSNTQIVRGMADFFAKRCDSEYRKSALREYTLDPRMNSFTSLATLSDVIFDWMTESPKLDKSSAAHFLSSFELFSQDNFQIKDMMDDDKLPEKQGIALYYNNAGKRRALKAMLSYVDALNEPCNARLFTDEIYDWLIENAEFAKWLNAGIGMQASKGVTFERIQPPFNSTEFMFSTIERWLPGYMAGAIQQYYYPWSRDKLHRRTLFVVPGHIAMCSNSIYGEHESLATILTRDPRLVALYNQEYELIMKRCRPAIRTFTADSERLFIEAEEIAAIEDVGVYKTNGLSVNTLPSEIIERIRRLDTPFAHRMCESLERRGQSRVNVLRDNMITDIMCLAKPEDVINGQVRIPGTSTFPQGAMYYSAREYRLHLERILWHLDNFPNYQAVFVDDPLLSTITMYVKGENRALLVKQSPPFAVFDVTEQHMATAFCDYLRRIAEEKMTIGSRRATIERLRVEIRQLSAEM